MYYLWENYPSLCKPIYNQRSKVEAVFSALKKRYGDQLYATKWFMRRREMAMRFIAYNVRIIIGIQIAREKNIPLWEERKQKSSHKRTSCSVSATETSSFTPFLTGKSMPGPTIK